MLLSPKEKLGQKLDNTLSDFGSSVSLTPNSIFMKLNLQVLRPTTSSLTLMDSSIKHPLGILVDVPIKTGDFYVVDHFVIVDLANYGHPQSILGSPFLATMGCKIYIKGDD